MWQLIINGPGYFDTSYDLPDGTTQVGRADENDIVLSGDLVSRKHCRLHVRADGVVFEDLGSRNGTRLNGDPVTGSVELKAGDVVGIGENSLSLRRLRASEALHTEMVDTGGGGRVRRFGRGVRVDDAVLVARDVKESSVLKALDNFAPFDLPAPPLARASDTDETDGSSTSENPLDDAADRVALQSLVMLYRVAETLARAPDLQAFLDETCDLVMARVKATTGVVLLRHESGVMVPAAVRHQQKLSRGEVPVSDSILEAALQKGQAIAVADVLDDSRFADRESVVLYGIDQVLCIPIGTRAPFAGVLYLNRTRLADERVEAHLDMCTAITQLIETGIQKFQQVAAPPGRAVERVKASLQRIYAPDTADKRAAELSGRAGPLTQLHDVQATVLFAELAGLAHQSARVPPQVLHELVTEWQRLATQLVFSFDGVVDLVSGDSLRAVFGTPAPRGDDAIRAVRAAMSIYVEWEKLLARRGPKERFHVRAGLTTGRVLSGLSGTELRLDSVTMGEPVVLTQLIAASADPGQVLITGKTLAHVGARFDVTPLGERTLGAQKVRTPLFEVLDEDSDSGTLSGIRS